MHIANSDCLSFPLSVRSRSCYTGVRSRRNTGGEFGKAWWTQMKSPKTGRKTLWVVLLLAGLLALLASACPAQEGAANEEGATGLRPAEIFCDEMVLQRDTVVPVWGWATPGAGNGAFRWAGEAGGCRSEGRWKVVLDHMPACADPTSMTISDGQREKVINGVLVVKSGCAQGSQAWSTLGELPSGLHELSSDPSVYRPAFTFLKQTTTSRPGRWRGMFEGRRAGSPVHPPLPGDSLGWAYTPYRDVQTLQVPLGSSTAPQRPVVYWVPQEAVREILAMTVLGRREGSSPTRRPLTNTSRIRTSS